MRRLFFALLAICPAAPAQWTLQDSHTTAGLRGIHSLGRGVAWASGASGVILRTINGGRTWRTCAIPPGAGKLDFRGVQAFDANAAIAMSAGPGDLSRVYKTLDACVTWKLLLTNPDKEGFWDAIQFRNRISGMLIGDPVQGQFPLFTTSDGGLTWQRKTLPAAPKQSLFAASNTSLLLDPRSPKFQFLTGGGPAAIVAVDANFSAIAMPVGLASSESAGGFSLASNPTVMVAVGGDYKLPDQTKGTAVYFDGKFWHAADTPPHGYRSAVAYDPTTKSWLAVGPNGTDVSTDDGRNWHPLKPTATEPPDADQQWNALSLPFVVGPKGRIGKLGSAVLGK